MSVWLALVLILGGSLAFGWLGRAVAQKATGNKPVFRDMPLAVAFGYVLGAVLLVLAVWYYFQPVMRDTGVPNAGDEVLVQIA